ncbi:WcaI family glycosyltransferase [Xanthobacteraceae bacterium Astr-EGSB]|uniref:WcaI family glycosyltransferase n=1 Tax=Astrobacterium formosum TaxID=3069710 RepID=UPI0027B7E2A6|nr:WcaI family glycosyltransferase [Xanthobacteraceae bacterium Astr-EGSB]
MRILLCGINYAPDLVGVPKYNTELCEWLAERGHDVRVVTAPPYYPAWRVAPEHRLLWPRTQTRNGVTLTRVPIYVPKTPSGARRILHHASFALASAPSVIAQARRFRPQVMMAVAPSLVSAALVAFVARRLKIASWLHVQDFEIDAAFDLGLLKGGRLRKAMLKAEWRILTAFDRVSTISPQMVRRLVEKGVPVERVHEVRNWVDTEAIVPLPPEKTLRAEFGYGPDDVVALYAGTMSAKQGLDLVVEAARALETRAPQVKFLLCGEGPYRPTLDALMAGLTNVRIIGFQDEARFARLLSTADMHLMPQRAEAADLVLPSKLGGILASGRPVIAMAAPGTGLAEEVEGAGIVVPPGDAGALAHAISAFAVNPTLRYTLGCAARVMGQSKWNMDAVISAAHSELLCLGLSCSVSDDGCNRSRMPQEAEGIEALSSGRSEHAPRSSLSRRPNMQHLYVQFGCGWSAPSGWSNYDCSPSVRLERLPLIGRFLRINENRFPDAVRLGDIVKGLPIADGEAAGVYASHVLEHLSFKDFYLAIRNAKRLLRAGGIFRLVVPDLESRAKYYISQLEAGAALANCQFMRTTYLGAEERPRTFRERIRAELGNSKHLWMWDFPSISFSLSEAGFSDIRRCTFGDCNDAAFNLVEERSRFYWKPAQDSTLEFPECAVEARA